MISLIEFENIGVPAKHPHAHYKKPPELHELISQQLTVHALSALQKESVQELTPEECAAICFFSGVEFRIDTISGHLHFQPCQITKLNGKWKTILPPETQGVPRLRYPARGE